MSPAQEMKLFNSGCSVVFFCAIALGLLGYFVHVSFAVAIIPLFAAWGFICRIKNKKDAEVLAATFDAAFEGFQGSRPELKKTLSYSYPNFSVCFRSKNEMLQAYESGHLNAFRKAVIKLYGFGGFDIEKGFGATYLGWESDFHKSREIDPSLTLWLEEQRKLSERYFRDD